MQVKDNKMSDKIKYGNGYYTISSNDNHIVAFPADKIISIELVTDDEDEMPYAIIIELLGLESSLSLCFDDYDEAKRNFDFFMQGGK